MIHLQYNTIFVKTNRCLRNFFQKEVKRAVVPEPKTEYTIFQGRKHTAARGGGANGNAKEMV